MERQASQQSTPVYHVCQQCNGAGCAFCADLCIIEGDLTPINRVIGIRSNDSLTVAVPVPDLKCSQHVNHDHDHACDCLHALVFSPAVGDWVCRK